jgi:hypothetical protein
VLANPPRIVAIYPGSFKPPHAGHLRAIEYLLNECGSDQIHIIISSRSRLIPGTAYALDADLARRLFELQLDYAGFPLDKITIEIAEHRAVDQALAYIGHAAKDQTLLFAIGQLDHERNDPRFADIDSLSANAGVQARVQVLPADENPIRASIFRHAIGQGDAGRTMFFEGMHRQLTIEKKEELWELVRTSLKPIAEIVRFKLDPILRGQFEVSAWSVATENETTPDPEFTWPGKDSSRLRAKYAGETVVSEGFFNDLGAKPAARIAAERRAIRRLGRVLDPKFRLPEIRYFDKRLRLLVTEEPTQCRLSDGLEKGCARPDAARLIGEYLAALHAAPRPDEPFWETEKVERCIWQSVVENCLNSIRRSIDDPSAMRIGQRLLGRAKNLFDEHVLHLCCAPASLAIIGDTLCIREFERSITRGDRAGDLGLLIGKYIQCGLANNITVCIIGDAVDEILVGYGAENRQKDPEFMERVACFAACTLVSEDYPSMSLRRLATSLLRDCESAKGAETFRRWFEQSFKT